MKQLLPFDRETELAMRAQVRQALAATIPAEHVDPVLDLAMHAVQEALRSADRILTSALDERHYIAALAPAMGLLAGRCVQIEEGLKQYAALRGMATGAHQVRFGELA